MNHRRPYVAFGATSLVSVFISVVAGCGDYSNPNAATGGGSGTATAGSSGTVQAGSGGAGSGQGGSGGMTGGAPTGGAAGSGTGGSAAAAGGGQSGAGGMSGSGWIVRLVTTSSTRRMSPTSCLLPPGATARSPGTGSVTIRLGLPCHRTGCAWWTT